MPIAVDRFLRLANRHRRRFGEGEQQPDPSLPPPNDELAPYKRDLAKVLAPRRPAPNKAKV